MPQEHYLKQNHLLAALPASELKILKPHLELKLLEVGEMLAEAGQRPAYSYFPVDTVISMYYRIANGDAAEIAMIGNEGMFSVGQVMGGESLPYYAVVETQGHAFRIERSVLMKELAHEGAFRKTMLLYSQAALTQMAQIAVCGKHHSLVQQLSLHLLLVSDKSLSDSFFLTHEALAHMLGVRREGVTAAAAKMRELGLIDYKRGHIRVTDRAGIEVLACDCYDVVRKEFKRLLGY